MEEINYEEDLKINVHELHKEWLRHSSLCMKWIKLASEAGAEYDRAKEAFDVIKTENKETIEIVKGELDQDIRARPDMYNMPLDKNGNPKTTESSVAAAIVTSDKYENTLIETRNKRQDAHDKMVKASTNYNLLKGAAETFSYQRKTALENEVRLWEQEFYSIPNLPKESKVDEKALNNVASEMRTQGQGQPRKRTRRT